MATGGQRVSPCARRCQDLLGTLLPTRSQDGIPGCVVLFAMDDRGFTAAEDSRRTKSVTLCSPASSLDAARRPRAAGLSGWTPAARKVRMHLPPAVKFQLVVA